MVIPRFAGRLGNSMFQIAAAIGYARKYGYQWAAPHDAGNSDSAIHRVFPNLPKDFVQGTRYHEHPSSFCPLHNTHFDNCHFNYHPIPDLGPNVTLSGFFQSWKYFQGQDEEIRKVFQLPDVYGYEDYVSVHIRRGDYVQHANSFPPVTKEYVDEALTRVPNLKVLCFSDDIAWCKETWGNSFEYSEGKSEAEDLSLMASCGHHIICNSTFSWWGAYLGHNPNRIVISPSCVRGNWFGMEAGVKQDCIDLLPPEWVQIKFR